MKQREDPAEVAVRLARALERAGIEPVPGEPIMASSVEDNLLWKLRGYRTGAEVSDQQWRDVLGLIRISGDKLDRAYLGGWAAHHGVDDLLERAMNQSGR